MIASALIHTVGSGLSLSLLLLPFLGFNLAFVDLVLDFLELRIVIEVESADDFRTRDIITLGG